MRKNLLLPTLAGLLAFGLACGGGEVTSTDGSTASGSAPAAAQSDWKPVKFCADIEVMSQCFDTDKTELSADDCMIAVSYKALPADGACPSEGRTGSCKIEGGVLHYYSKGKRNFDRSKAKEWCTDVKEGTPISL
jgi:hypothetical protein